MFSSRTLKLVCMLCLQFVSSEVQTSSENTENNITNDIKELMQKSVFIYSFTQGLGERTV